MGPDPGRIGIWGRSGSGKSTYAKALLAGRRRVVVFDPLEEYPGTAATSLAGVLGALNKGWRGGFRVAFRPASDPEAALDRLAACLFLVQDGYRRGVHRLPLTFVVEEAAMAAPNVRRPVDMAGFAGLCARGRHYGIALIGISQRMAEVSTTFRGATSTDVFFPLRSEPDHQEALKLIGRRHEGALRALQNHDYLLATGGRVFRGRNRL
jgi:DNA helicase HerA-like ATPase